MGAHLTTIDVDGRRSAGLIDHPAAAAVRHPNEGVDVARPTPSRSPEPLADGGSDPVVASGEPIIDGVLYDLKWDVTDLTYSFPTSGADYEVPYGDDEPTNGFAAFTAAQKGAVDTLLDGVSIFSALTFDKVSGGGGDLRYAESDGPEDSGAPGYAFLPGDFPEAGDVWTNHIDYEAAALVVGSWAWRSLQHETGHALGLMHGHDASNPFGALPTEFDGHEFSIMTYKSYIGDSATDGYENETYGHPQTFMMADIAALQYLYGANYGPGSNHTDTTYTWSPTTGETFIDGVGQGTPGANVIFRTVWDGGGFDVYDLSAYDTGVSINIGAGEWSTFLDTQRADLDTTSAAADRIARGNVANALLFDDDTASLIENATGGAGADVITGNEAKNLLAGGGDKDVIAGLDGKDTLDGGTGKDKLNGGTGNDLIEGGASNDKLTGAAGLDTLNGGAGADELKGSGGADTFLYLLIGDCSGDLIADLEDAADIVDLSAIDANTGKAGDQPFKLVGAFTGKAAQAVLDFAGGTTELRLDTDGDGTANAVIDITGDHEGFVGFVL